jgi:hypothetical protein
MPEGSPVFNEINLCRRNALNVVLLANRYRNTTPQNHKPKINLEKLKTGFSISLFMQWLNFFRPA